jgi:signal transduction histidine kinase
LAIAREIVHRHGGDIEITSSRRDGTRVVVRLPKG